MTPKQKQLLLKDLCGRMPFEPICEYTDVEDGCKVTAKLGYSLRDFIAGKVIIKPYLRPMSSITEEEMFDFHENGGLLNHHFKYEVELNILTVGAIDWLNKYHFDYRGLIEKGLAIEVTNENNPYKL